MISARRRAELLADDVAPTLDALARATAGGLSLSRALAELEVGSSRPFGSLLRDHVVRHRWDGPLFDSFAAMSATVPCTEAAFALTCLELLAQFGGAIPMALDRGASAVRERRAAVAERRAQAAQARLSSLVLSVLPVGFGAWSLRSDHRVSRFALHTPLGWTCLGVGFTLNALGWLWMRHIIGASS